MSSMGTLQPRGETQIYTKGTVLFGDNLKFPGTITDLLCPRGLVTEVQLTNENAGFVVSSNPNIENPYGAVVRQEADDVNYMITIDDVVVLTTPRVVGGREVWIEASLMTITIFVKRL